MINSKNFILLALLPLFMACGPQDQGGFKGYLISEFSSDTVLWFDLNDVVCADFIDQKFMLSDTLRNQIDRVPILGAAKYYLSFSMDNTEAFRAYVYSSWASYDVRDSCRVTMTGKPDYTLFPNKWLVIDGNRKPFQNSGDATNKLIDLFRDVGLECR